MNHKRVERIWRREGLKVPKKQPKRGRLWLNDGSCIRLRVERRDHVWAYDFVHGRTQIRLWRFQFDGRVLFWCSNGPAAESGKGQMGNMSRKWLFLFG